MKDLKLLVGVLGGTLVLIFGIAFLFSSQNNQAETAVADPGLTEGDRRLVYYEDPNQPAEGDEEASETAMTPENVVTIVEFSDLQCPACSSADPMVQQVLNQYPGQVELVYRHFPLEQLHPNARAASIASEIVAEQGLFFEYKTLLFESQDEWSSSDDPIPFFIQYAEEVGADTTDFESKMEDPTYNGLVEDDVKDGFSLGINSTPTFFVDGEKLNNVGFLSAAVAERL